MLRKRSAIFLFALAQLVLLAHSVFAHHHHDLSPSWEHAQEHGQEGNSKNPLEGVFSGFAHSGEQISYTNSDTAEAFVAKQASQPMVAYIQKAQIAGDYLTAHKEKIFPPDRCELYQSLHLLTNSLRGPPAFIVA